jgi:hypothetical protein
MEECRAWCLKKSCLEEVKPTALGKWMLPVEVRRLLAIIEPGCEMCKCPYLGFLANLGGESSYIEGDSGRDNGLKSPTLIEEPTLLFGLCPDRSYLIFLA